MHTKVFRWLEKDLLKYEVHENSFEAMCGICVWKFEKHCNYKHGFISHFTHYHSEEYCEKRKLDFEYLLKQLGFTLASTLSTDSTI